MTLSSRLRLEFLGSPRLWRNGVETPLGDRKLALLLFLLAAQGRSDRIRLAAWLWPEVEPDKQLASLRLRVHKLRQLDERLLLADGPELALAPQVEHDLSFLRRRATMPLELALALVDSPLLSGIDLRGLAQVECMVEGFRDLMISHAIDAIHQQVRECRGPERIREGIRWLRRIHALAPLNEPACRLLMQFYLLDHDRSSALLVYEHLRSCTRRLLGVEPGARTARLQARILLGDEHVAEDFELEQPAVGSLA